MPDHTPDLEPNLDMKQIPVKATTSLNSTARAKVGDACFVDRPNTALDFTAPHEYAPLKHKYRPQTSAGVRPDGGGGAGQRAPHPSAPRQPARRKRYKRRKARFRIVPHVTRSRELRAGCMRVGCECVQLNGLQDDCRRRECAAWHGNRNPECALAACGPSVYGNARHLQAIVDDFHRLRKRQREDIRAVLQQQCAHNL